MCVGWLASCEHSIAILMKPKDNGMATRALARGFESLRSTQNAFWMYGFSRTRTYFNVDQKYIPIHSPSLNDGVPNRDRREDTSCSTPASFSSVLSPYRNLPTVGVRCCLNYPTLMGRCCAGSRSIYIGTRQSLLLFSLHHSQYIKCFQYFPNQHAQIPY